MFPDFPSAKNKIQKSFDDFFDFAVNRHLGVPFSNIPKKIMYEGNKLKQKYSDQMQHESDLTLIKSSFDFTLVEGKRDPFIIYQKLWDSAKDFAGQQLDMLLKGVTEITELTGNVVNTGKELQIKDLLDMYEKIEIPFDESGRPRLPMMVGGEKMINDFKNLLSGNAENEFKTKMDEIIERKRKLWYDRENNRKLVD